MTQQQINSTVWFIFFFTIVWFISTIMTFSKMFDYDIETRNRLSLLEEQVNYQVERVSRTDNNLYYKIMSDETSELVKESYNLVEDMVWCMDCMFYTFENKWVVFSTNLTWEQKYYYVDVDRKYVQWNYIPKF